MPSRTADHDRELAFEIETFRYRWPDHLAVVADKRIGQAHEHARRLGDVAAGLGGVRAIIDAGAEDLVRIGNRRQEAHVGERVIAALALGGPANLVERARRERIAQAAVLGAPAHGDEAVAGDDTEGGSAVGEIARELHFLLLVSIRRATPLAPIPPLVGRSPREARWVGPFMHSIPTPVPSPQGGGERCGTASPQSL